MLHYISRSSSHCPHFWQMLMGACLLSSKEPSLTCILFQRELADIYTTPRIPFLVAASTNLFPSDISHDLPPFSQPRTCSVVSGRVSALQLALDVVVPPTLNFFREAFIPLNRSLDCSFPS